MLIGKREGVVRVYSVKRQPEQDRWDGQLIKEMKGTPRQPDPNREGSAIQTRVNFDPPSPGEPQESITKKDVDIRRTRVTQEHLREHGYTEGCDGCSSKEQDW